jgi:hypothetical protein
MVTSTLARQLGDAVADLADRARTVPTVVWAVATAAVLAVVAVGATAFMVDPDVGAETRLELETLRAQMMAGLDVASGDLPSGVVRRVVEDGDALVGTIAAPDGGTCWGFTVTVDDRWLVDGEPDGLVVGPVGVLDGAACVSP